MFCPMHANSVRSHVVPKGQANLCLGSQDPSQLGQSLYGPSCDNPPDGPPVFGGQEDGGLSLLQL